MGKRHNPRLKPANEIGEYTLEQVNELKICMNDPIHFIKKYVKIQHPMKGTLPFDLFPYQENMIRKFHENRFTITLSARQTGKALALDTLIPTPIGWTTMGEISEGDVILDSNGKPTTVTFVTEIMYNHQCYAVNFSNNETIIADANHLWEVNDTVADKTLIKTTKQLVEKDKDPRIDNVTCQYSINNTKPLELPEQELETDPYVLGTRLNVNNNQHIPTQYLRSSVKQRNSLLQGLIDTCGTIDNVKDECELNLANSLLTHDVNELICSLGLTPTISKVENNSIIFTTTKRSTKRRYITSIVPVDSVPVKCITVNSDNHLFLAGKGMIPTHNSTVSAAYLLWYATFNSDKTILIASRSNSHAMEMIQRIRFAYEMLPYWIKPGVLEDGWNKHGLGFDNGSRIMSEATSENSGRGFSISLLYLDEFAFVPPNIQSDFWTSISPTLATGGSCIMTSTPNGDLDVFSQIWRGAELEANEYVPIRVYWDEPPGRDEDFKEKEIGKIGQRKWNQEYECEFLSAEALLIDSIFLATLTKSLKGVKPVLVNKKKFVFWDNIKERNTYLIGVDPATGSGNDFSVISIVHFPSLVQVGEWRSNTMSTGILYTTLKNVISHLEKKQCTVYFSIENNGVGEGVISLYNEDDTVSETAEFVSEPGIGRLGFTTTAKTKMKACINFKEMLEAGMIQIRSPFLLAELKSYIRKKGSYEAQTGSTDDSISSMLIVIRIIEEMASFDQTAYDKLYSGHYEQWDDEDWDGYDDYDDLDQGLPMIF